MFEGVEEVPDQRVRVGFFRINDVRFELLEPTEPGSPVATFLDKRGEGLHHVAFTVEDLEARIAELKQSGLRMIDEVPRPVRTTCGLRSSTPRARSVSSPNCANRPSVHERGDADRDGVDSSRQSSIDASAILALTS